MRITIETKYLMKHSAQPISITFTCRDFYITKNTISFNNSLSIALKDTLEITANIRCYDSVLYDNEKRIIVPTTFNTNFIPTDIDNVKSIIEEIKESVIK